MEIFKDIPGFIGYYQASSYGRILSLARTRIGSGGLPVAVKERFIKFKKDKDGYLSCTLSKDGKHHDKRIHRIVAESFIPNVENKKQVNHIDTNKANNRVDNLEWNTDQENKNHCRKTILKDYKGSKHVLSKITEQDVIEIRMLYSMGVPQVKIAPVYGITQSQVSYIVLRKQWTHI